MTFARRNGTLDLPNFDFDADLPPGNFFQVWFLAKIWRVTSQHVFNLIDSGELEVGVDLRNAAASRSTIRIPRKSVVDFLDRRKDLATVAEMKGRTKTT